MHKYVVLGSIFAFFASQSAQGQVTVDVTKINCDQFVHHKISEPSLIAAWLSGYYNAKRNKQYAQLLYAASNLFCGRCIFIALKEEPWRLLACGRCVFPYDRHQRCYRGRADIARLSALARL